MTNSNLTSSNLFSKNSNSPLISSSSGMKSTGLFSSGSNSNNNNNQSNLFKSSPSTGIFSRPSESQGMFSKTVTPASNQNMINKNDSFRLMNN